MTGVYLITCIPTSARYVGSSVNVERRWGQHKRDLRRGRHHNRWLQAAWNKYGEANFCFELLQEVRALFLISVEQSFFDYYKSIGVLMNLSDVARGGCGPHSAATRARMSATRKGVKHSAAHVANMTGWTHAPETIARMREVQAGRMPSAEAFRKAHAATRGSKRPHKEETKVKFRAIQRLRSKRVVRINPETGERKLYESLNEAARDGYAYSSIQHCLTGKMRQHRGYLWEKV